MALKPHIDNWVNKAEPDYYTMFIKAWIPLNAWYVAEYNTTSDSEAIKKLKDSSSKIKQRIEALLLNADEESKQFRSELFRLHLELEGRRIMHKGVTFVFSAVYVDGASPTTATGKDKFGNIYKAMKNVGHYRMVVEDKGGKTKMDCKLPQHKLSELLMNSQYIGLDTKIQENVRNYFTQIDPNRPIDLVERKKSVSKIVLDESSKLSFIQNTDVISKVIVQSLYTLHCMLFHGEIDPTEANMKMYEHGFQILRAMIKILK